eukprot:c18941_g1_i1.p1 GENE.c18941_g1_i1~~c18941_g1_i1.p1  ORF type:complete len:293 (-),score=85.82 c18941_g1_i1:163-1041(-)
MRSRLGEIVSSAPTGDIEMATSKSKVEVEESSPLPSVFQDVGQVNQNLLNIRRLMEKISEKHSSALTAISDSQKKAINRELEGLTDDATDTISKTKKTLDAMSKAIDQMKSAKANQNHIRMASTMHGTLSVKFLDLVKDYNDLQTSMRAQIRSKVQEELKIVNPAVTPEQVDEVIQGDKQVFSQAMLESGHAHAELAFRLAQEKKDDILKIEQQLEYIRALFHDLHTLIESQGEMIDSIEQNIDKTMVATTKGVQELRKATSYQKKSRKKMCCIGIIMMIILIVLVVVFIPK